MLEISPTKAVQVNKNMSKKLSWCQIENSTSKISKGKNIYILCIYIYFYTRGQSRGLKQVNISPLFVHISPAFLQHMICSTCPRSEGGHPLCRFARTGNGSRDGWELSVVNFFELFICVFMEPGRWKLWEEGRRKKRRAIKSPSLTDADLGKGRTSLSCL